MKIAELCEPLPTPLPTPEECYHWVRGLVRYTVWVFTKRHGGDFHELLQDADDAWFKGDTAYRGRATNGRAIHPDYRVEIRRWVWFELFDRYRVTSQHRRENKLIIKPDEHITKRRDPCPEFNMVDFLDELSEDARVAVRLVLDAPAELAALAAAKGGQPRNWRSTVRAHLAEAGWCAERINESFQEVREALR